MRVEFRLAALLAVCSVCLAVPAAQAASAKRFAIVVGSNDPGRSGLQALSYADDDAVRNYEMLRAQGTEAVLLTALDDETRSVYPWAAAVSETPGRAHLLETITSVLGRVAAAKQQGDTVDLFFVYSGHGGFTDAGVGALFLSDGAFTRGDLYEQILSKSTADFNHLIIDACDAYFFVTSRGDKDSLDRRLEERARKYLDDQTLDRFANTGAILATSRAAQAHEWSEYQGGVFSHQVRSALLGAGDVNGDGAVSYAEIGAFVEAANARLIHPKARLDVFVHAPAREPGHPIANWKGAAVATLLLERNASGHLWVEDSRGTRLVESNKTAEQAVRLVLPRRDRYYLTLGPTEYAFNATPGHEATLKKMAPSTARVRARGSIADALRDGLFAEPYGTHYYEGYRAKQLSEEQAQSDLTATAPTRDGVRRAVAYGFLGAAALTCGVAAMFKSMSNSAYDRYNSALPEDKERWRDRTHTLDSRAATSLAIAGGAAAVGAGILLYDWWGSRSGVAVTAGPGTVYVAGRF